MRVKVFGVEMTVPNKLLDKLDSMDVDKLMRTKESFILPLANLSQKGKLS